MSAGYLKVTIYRSQVSIFNCGTWWLVSWQGSWCTSQLCWIVCWCSRTQWVVWEQHLLLCMTWSSPWPGFQCAGSVHCPQYEQYCIQVSTLDPIFLVVYFLSRLCHLVGKRVVFWTFLKWFLSIVFFTIASVNWWASMLSHPGSGSPRKHCMGSRSWCNGRLGSLAYKRKKNSFSTVARFGVTL